MIIIKAILFFKRGKVAVRLVFKYVMNSMKRRQRKLSRGLETSIVTLIILISAIALAIAVVGVVFGIFSEISITPNITFYQGTSSLCPNGTYITYTLVNLNEHSVSYTIIAYNSVSIVSGISNCLVTNGITAIITVFVPASETGFIEVLADGHSALAIIV